MRNVKSLLLLVAIGVPVAAGVGCGAGDDDDDDDGSGGPLWGYVEVTQGGPGLEGEAALFATDWDFFPVTLDTCLRGLATPLPTPTFVDAGPTIRLEAVGTNLILDRDADNLYTGSTSARPGGGMFDIVISGSEEVPETIIEGAMALSRDSTLLSSMEITRGSDYLLEWSGSGDGWATFGFLVPGGTLACRLVDDGSFTIPGTATAILPSNGGDLTFVIVGRKNVLVDDLDLDVVTINFSALASWTEL